MVLFSRAYREKMHEYTIEILYHYTCSKCKNWWSYAMTPNAQMLQNSQSLKLPKTEAHCPECGTLADIKLKDRFIL